jgi:hypothetical protein
MSFASPWAFYLFALAGGVILLYFLRRRARPYPVSALFLWEEMERQERRAWRLARHSVLNLLLQLLALACLVLALAGPASPTAGTPGRLALILGREREHASGPGREEPLRAGSRAGGRTPLSRERGGDGDPGPAPSALAGPLTSDKRLAEAAVRGSEPTLEGEAKLEELLALLESQARSPNSSGSSTSLTMSLPAFGGAPARDRVDRQRGRSPEPGALGLLHPRGAGPGRGLRGLRPG